MIVPFIIGVGVTISAYALFPISIYVLHFINNAPASIIPAIPNLYTTYSALLGISTVIVAFEFIGGLSLIFNDPGFAPVGFRIMGSIASFMGVIGCGFLLDHLNQALTNPIGANLFAQILARDEVQLQALVDCQPMLIAGVVICSAIFIGIIAQGVYSLASH